MAQNRTNTPHLCCLAVDATAHWADTACYRVDARHYTDYASNDGIPLIYASTKPLLFIPVSRRAGVDKFPDVVLKICLVESTAELMSKEFDVSAWTGNAVEFEIENVWDGEPSEALRLPGHLDLDLRCEVKVPGLELETWFDRRAPLKAAVNENLLDFRFVILDPKDHSAWLKGRSDNQLFVYRRKTIVFLPGLFASKFLVKVDDREVLAYPNFSVDPSQLPLEISLPLGGAIAAVNVVTQWKDQKIGILECDDHGNPLAEAEDKPKVLTGGPVGRFRVADFFVQCREARMRRLRRVPEELLLYELRVIAYDWRTDLTARAESILKRLHDIQEELRRFADTDDQVALVGHSTGGVIMRRMLCEPDSKNLISHAFFIDVPFRGAPKALSMLLTGCDWPGGNRGIPFLLPDSLVDVALSQPIVYHLAPSSRYPHSVVSLPANAPDASGNREDEKRELMKTAIECGIYRKRRVVNASLAVNRGMLALCAGRWHNFCAALQSWEDVAEAYRNFLPKQEFEAFDERERHGARLSSRLSQDEFTLNSLVRTPGGWNEHLAETAKNFHDVSETGVDKSWAANIFLFYAKGRATTHRIRIDAIEMSELRDAGMALSSDGLTRPKKGIKYSGSNHDGLKFEQINAHGRDVQINRWALTAERGDGDGTVPICSQLGFGMQVNVFKPIKDGPKHMDAPNSPWVWDRIIEVLQGLDVSGYLAHDVCTVTGEERSS